MFNLNEGNRYLVCLQGVDLRKGVDGLCGLIRYLSLNPANGNVYVGSAENVFLILSNLLLYVLERISF